MSTKEEGHKLKIRGELGERDIPLGCVVCVPLGAGNLLHSSFPRTSKM